MTDDELAATKQEFEDKFNTNLAPPVLTGQHQADDDEASKAEAHWQKHTGPALAKKHDPGRQPPTLAELAHMGTPPQDVADEVSHRMDDVVVAPDAGYVGEGCWLVGHRWRVMPRAFAQMFTDPRTGEDWDSLMLAGIKLLLLDDHSKTEVTMRPMWFAHAAWREACAEARRQVTSNPAHPLEPLVQHWFRLPRIKRYQPRRRGNGNLPNLSKAKQTELPDLAFAWPERQATLPGMELDELGQPFWLLELYKRMGGEFLREGRGAPIELRLYIGALCALDMHDRDGHMHGRHYTVDELIDALWPHGWHNRARDWRKLPEAIARLNRSSATMLDIDGVANDIFRVSKYPTTEASWRYGRDQERKFVEVLMRIPPASARGDRVDLHRLAELGVVSAPLYCALLSAYSHIGRTARHGLHTREVHPPLLGPDGEPIRKGRRGRIVRDPNTTVPNPMNKYQGDPLTAHALARMCGLDPNTKQYRARAVAAYERLHDDGDIEFVRDGGGYRICSPPV